ncbi:hypothetical protein EPO34_02140 [Patescibacteria group bacterium]|nr:MAG: hypothetical protein EPO34_02140 [Patescibacteria group bacterium]
MPSNNAWNEPLKLVSCAACDERRTDLVSRVLGSRDDTSLIHAACERCGCATLSLVMRRGEAATSVALLTDLSADDALRFQRPGAITVDDVIELHAFVDGPGLAALARSVTLGKKRVRFSSKTRSNRS